jgi:hypothetical protein
LDARDGPLVLDELEFSELADVLEVATALVIDHEVSIDVLAQLLVVDEEGLNNCLLNVAVVDGDDGGDAAKEGRDQLVLLPVLHDVPRQQLPRPLVVHLLEQLGDVVALRLVLALVQLLLELLVLLLPRRLVLAFAEVGQFQVELALELVLEDLCVIGLVDVLLHDVVHLDQFLLVVLEGGVEVDGVHDHLQLPTGEDHLLLQLVVERLNGTAELPRHP